MIVLWLRMNPEETTVVPAEESAGRSITREELAALPIRRYDGPVSVVNDMAGLREAHRALRDERVIGFDTETRPSFNKGQVYLPAVVQMATERCVYVFQLRRVDMAGELSEVFEDADRVKTGVALDRDLKELNDLFPFTVRNVVDLGDVAKANGVAQSGMRNLAGMLLGFRVTKGARTSNWARHELTEKQVIDGGMLPKVQSGVEALHAGVRKIHIVDGRMTHSLLLEIFTDKGVGTEIVHE